MMRAMVNGMLFMSSGGFVAGMGVSTGAVGLSAPVRECGGVQTDRADAGQGPPVTWFGLVFEVVELGDRHGRVVLDDAIHAEQVLGPVDAFGDQLRGVHRIRGRAADLHEVVPSRTSG